MPRQRAEHQTVTTDVLFVLRAIRPLFLQGLCGPTCATQGPRRRTGQENPMSKPT